MLLVNRIPCMTPYHSLLKRKRQRVTLTNKSINGNALPNNEQCYYRNGGLKLFASLLYFRSVPPISKSAKDPLSSRCLSHVFSLNSNLVPIPKHNAKAKLT